MPIKEAKRSYKPKILEKDIQDFWSHETIYEKIQKMRENNPKYSFLDGPPYCSGRIHLGTAWNKIIKDTFLRFKSMSGFNVRRQAGWDTHGLPIEHKVEGIMNIKSKKEIEDRIGIDVFVKKCREFAIENKFIMTQQFKLLGVWMDWDNPYVTFDTGYMESCWWTLQKAHQKDLLIKDLRVITWCPRCETALAMAEIDYENKDDPSIYVKFPLKTDDKYYILIWTTTPWTLPANMAVCVHPDFDYAYVKVGEEVYLMAQALIDSIFGDQDYEVINVVKGSELEGIEYYHPLLDEIPIQRDFKHIILPGEHVTLTEGTGCVHTAPGHGPDDFEIGKKYGLPIFSPVDEAGLFKEDAGKYGGEFVKDADPYIIADLDAHGLLLKAETINHRYGFCWRCKTPIIYLATEQWFLKITAIKNKMLKELEKVEWIPSWAGESRFRNWVENARDWTISRQRYWGIPIPIWICQNCGDMMVIGSIAELKEVASEGTIKGDFIHRPHVDEIIIKCNCGGNMKRIPDVLDVWIDSGVAGWAALNYPRETELFEEWYPYDFITEGHDQTRGWFYSQLGCGLISLDSIPYRKVLMHGFTLDDEGKKMSKSLGNVVEPDEVIEKYGADVLRFYLLWGNKPWEDLKFNWEEVKNVAKMFNILWNVYVFTTTYMAIDNFNPTLYQIEDLKLRDEDYWIMSRAQSLTKIVNESLDSLYLHKATRSINQFILEDLSRWYIRLIRGRTWIEKEDPDKLGAYYTLYHVMKQLLIVMSPITPHISEEIYQNLVRGVEDDAPESIHMEDWTFNENLIHEDLEESMNVVREIIEACARARDIARYKLRWPVKEVIIVSEDFKILKAARKLNHIIMEQANTKELVSSNYFEDIKINAKPNLKTLGPKLRGDVPKVAAKLAEVDGADVVKALESDDKYEVIIEDQLILLNSEDITFETELPENIVTADFEGGSVFVDTELTLEILSESMARELIRRIQDMRKDIDLDVESNIQVFLVCSKQFRELIKTFLGFISHEVRAEKFIFSPSESGYTKKWNIEDEEIIITIK
ncbi:MAG: isoleucine--tRNA ligase [Methanobacterium sp.]